MSRPEPLRTLPEQAFRARARLVALLLCGICFAGLIARLYWLQLAAGDWYTRRALGQQLRDTVVPADRGRIYSADGVLLAANSSCWTLRASPREMPADKLELAAHGLAQILELDEAALLEKFRDRASNDCLLRYRVERSMADAVRDFCEENGITGIRINQDSKRWYPQGEFLASVLGFTNVDNAGVSGLELEYNEQLTGQNGVVLTAVNAWGYTLEQSYETEQFPVEGSSLWLTIDANIQHYLENALNYAVQEHHVAARAVGIVLDVNAGAVLAMSTTPAYDPNQPRVLYDEAARAAVDALSGEQRAAALQLAQQTQWRNKAVSDLYEPGSVRQPQAPRDPDRDAGAGKFLQPELYPDRSAAWQGGLLRLLCRLRPAGAHRHRPARRAEKEPVLHRRPHGAGRACLLRLRAKQQDFLSGNGRRRVRSGQRRKTDAALPRIGHSGPGRHGAGTPGPRVQTAGDPAGDFRRHAGDDGSRCSVRRRTQRADLRLPGGRQERHQPKAGQHRRKSPHCQLCGRGAHRRPAVSVSGLPG